MAPNADEGNRLQKDRSLTCASVRQTWLSNTDVAQAVILEVRATRHSQSWKSWSAAIAVFETLEPARRRYKRGRDKTCRRVEVTFSLHGACVAHHRCACATTDSHFPRRHQTCLVQCSFPATRPITRAFRKGPFLRTSSLRGPVLLAWDTSWICYTERLRLKKRLL